MKVNIAYFVLLVMVLFSCQKLSQKKIAENIEVLMQASEMDSSLSRMYAANEFQPIWVKSQGLKKTGEDFIAESDKLIYDGLEKEHYFTKEQNQQLHQIQDSKDPAVHASLDIAISKSFLAMASDLNIGRIDPATTNIEWKMERKAPTVDFGELLLSIAEGESLKDAFGQLRPENGRYRELTELLARLLDQTGKEAERVNSFEGKIENYSRSDLITKIKVNLERLRWLPDVTDPERDKVVVNIPDFHLFYIEDKDTVFTSKVVVGKEYRQTPVFKAEMSYLVFNPSWTLPETILWEDVIPSIQNDVRYLVENNMKVLDYQEKEVDYEEIEWDELKDENDFPFLIRQSPGMANPLGRVKFMFPNEYSIYIHDSPAQNLFSLNERMFSSGCIRMENAAQFAALLLEETDAWDGEKIHEAMDYKEGVKEEMKVDLEKNLDVWILYLSVWGNGENIQVREDVYGMDRKIALAMELPLSDNFL